MLYTKSAFVPLDAVITEWSALSGNGKGEILQYLDHFRRCGLIFDGFGAIFTVFGGYCPLRRHGKASIAIQFSGG